MFFTEIRLIVQLLLSEQVEGENHVGNDNELTQVQLDNGLRASVSCKCLHCYGCQAG